MAQKDAGMAIGIDLGTTYSCVGVWMSDRVEIIPNEIGRKKTPSYVAFCDTGRLIGEEAKSRVSFNSSNTVFNIKRLMGRRSYNDDHSPITEIVKFWPFKVTSDTSKRRYMVSIAYKGEDKHFLPEEISSMVLTKMRDIAESYLGTTVRDAVISVPACFNTAQRQATMDAGVVAGLNVIRLINEPSAAALAYGFLNNVGWEVKKTVLVFDLGGGNLDVSLLSIDQGTFKVMSTAGDPSLGGEDFDDAMVNHCVLEFKKKHKLDIGSDSRAIRRLKGACEKAKHALSVTLRTTIEIDCLCGEIDFGCTIHRSYFENLTSHLLRKCKETVDRCLMDARLSPNCIDDVLLAGGSTRMPMVQKMLRVYFGKELCKSVNADEAIAYGATLQAAMLTCKANEEVSSLALEDVTPLDFHLLLIKAKNHETLTLFSKNTAIPVKTIFDCTLDQYVRSLCAFEGKYILGRLIQPGYYKLSGMLNACIDENGILRVSLCDSESNQENKAEIPMSRLSEEEIQRLVENAEVYNVQDKEHKNRVKEKNSLEKCVYDVRKAVNDEKLEAKLDAADKKEIENALEKVIEWLASIPLAEVKEYKDKMVELQGTCDPILNKILQEAEKDESNEPSPKRSDGPSLPDGDSRRDSVNCNPEAGQPHSDNITESDVVVVTSHGAVGADESKGMIHPENGAGNVDGSGGALLEFVVDSSFLMDGTTSKLRIRFPHSSSKVELTSETKLAVKSNDVDVNVLLKILSTVREWAHALALGIYNELVRMLHSKSQSNSCISTIGVDSQPQIKRSRPDDGTVYNAQAEFAADSPNGDYTRNMEVGGHPLGAGVGCGDHSDNGGSSDHRKSDNTSLGDGSVVKSKAKLVSPDLNSSFQSKAHGSPSSNFGSATSPSGKKSGNPSDTDGQDKKAQSGNPSSDDGLKLRNLRNRPSSHKSAPGDQQH